MPEPGFVRSRGCAEISICKIVVNIRIVRPIEYIEEFKPELKNYSLSNVSVIVEVNAGFIEIRSTEPVRFLVSLGTERRQPKVTLGNRPKQPGN